jgi:uncharacterized protein (TIGR02145 family)
MTFYLNKKLFFIYLRSVHFPEIIHSPILFFMKEKYWISRLILIQFGIGVFFILNTGCKKTADDTTQGSVTAPMVTTATVTSIASTTASCGGMITSNGGATITARGVCWSTNHNPTVADNKTSDGSGNGSFTSSLQGLLPVTPYYVRAFASNSAGTAYGAEATFTTMALDPGTVLDYDGNVYHTVTIGAQVWLVENLKVTHYRNGDPVTHGTTKSLMNKSEGEGMYYNYSNSDSIAHIYGRLYNFYAGVDSRGLAPIGFHVASDAEWTILADYLGGGSLTGGMLKEGGTSHWASPNLDATNSTGFTALPGGAYNGLEGTFGFLGQFACFWTSTSASTYYADGRSISYTSGYLYGAGSGDGRKLHGWSVRCLQGEKKKR